MAKKEGSIILDSDFLNWKWFKDAKTMHVFMWLLCEANLKESHFDNYVVKRGEVVTKNEIIATACGLKIQNVRKALANLQSSGDITRQRLRHNQLITVTNFDSYIEN